MRAKRAARSLRSTTAARRVRPARQGAISPDAVADVLRLDASNKAARAKIASLLKTWTKNGMFVVVDGEDDKQMPRKFIEVGTPQSEVWQNQSSAGPQSATPHPRTPISFTPARGRPALR